MSNVVRRFALLIGLWLVLTSGEPAGLIPGALTAAAATAVSLRVLPPRGRVRLLALLHLAPRFAWRSAIGGFDVAWRALHPRMPLRPAWLDYPAQLPAGTARVSLANEISLMPGTLVAGGSADRLYVHCLDYGQPVTAYVAKEERQIAKTIGIELEPRDPPAPGRLRPSSPTGEAKPADD